MSSDTGRRLRQRPLQNEGDVFGEIPPLQTTKEAIAAFPANQHAPDLLERVESSRPAFGSQVKAQSTTCIALPEDSRLKSPQTAKCARHRFRMAISYRIADTRDEVLDRRRRQRKDLLDRTSETSSRIYDARYSHWEINPAVDANYLPPNEEVEEENSAEQGANEDSSPAIQTRLALAEHVLQSAGTPRRTCETSLNVKAARRKEIEDALLAASDGRLKDRLIEIHPSGDMEESERTDFQQTLKGIVYDMKDPSSPLGRLVEKIKPLHRKKASGGEDELAKEFANFSNLVVQRLTRAKAGQDEQPLSGLFRFSGHKPMQDGHIPHAGKGAGSSEVKFDIIVHGEGSDGDEDRRLDHASTFGEVKRQASLDLKDSLLGQMLRYLVSPLHWLGSMSKASMIAATDVVLSSTAATPTEPSSLGEEYIFLVVRAFAPHL